MSVEDTVNLSNVSTHSRPKAAGRPIKLCNKQDVFQHTAARRRLDTTMPTNTSADVFQHTAARRRLDIQTVLDSYDLSVSTHSRPKAAGSFNKLGVKIKDVSTHSRPKAAGAIAFRRHEQSEVSTHSRPKAAGNLSETISRLNEVSTHSRPKAAGFL